MNRSYEGKPLGLVQFMAPHCGIADIKCDEQQIVPGT